MRVILADKAKSDLFRLYTYSEQRSPLAAEKILARIDKKFDQLTWFPFIGRERSSLAPGLRGAVVGTHLISTPLKMTASSSCASSMAAWTSMKSSADK